MLIRNPPPSLSASPPRFPFLLGCSLKRRTAHGSSTRSWQESAQSCSLSLRTTPRQRLPRRWSRSEDRSHSLPPHVQPQGASTSFAAALEDRGVRWSNSIFCNIGSHGALSLLIVYTSRSIRINQWILCCFCRPHPARLPSQRGRGGELTAKTSGERRRSGCGERARGGVTTK